jgi:hypothetical protein
MQRINTPLHLAAQGLHRECVVGLLGKGATQTYNLAGMTPLMITVEVDRSDRVYKCTDTTCFSEFLRNVPGTKHDTDVAELSLLHIIAYLNR